MQAPTISQKDIVLSNFFKSNKNLEDISPLVIVPKPKPIPFFVTSSNGSKVRFNPNFNRTNFAV